MNTPINQRTVTLKMRRIDLCNMIQAVRVVRDEVGESGWNRWNGLYETLKAELTKFDDQIEEGEKQK